MGELAEAAFLLRLAWTPDELANADDRTVRRIMALLNAEAEYAKSKNQGA